VNLAHDLGSPPQDHADLGRHPRITPISGGLLARGTDLGRPISKASISGLSLFKEFE